MQKVSFKGIRPQAELAFARPDKSIVHAKWEFVRENVSSQRDGTPFSILSIKGEDVDVVILMRSASLLYLAAKAGAVKDDVVDSSKCLINIPSDNREQISFVKK